MKDPKLTYYGKVSESGEISLPKRLRKEVSEQLAGHGIEVTFRRKRKRRSNEQNAYYWGVVIPYVLRGFIELGNDFQEGNKEHHEIAHEFLKGKFLHNGLDFYDAEGNVYTSTPSTKRCTTTEMMDYIDMIQRWAAEYLNVNIPDPDEQLNFFAHEQ